MCFLCKGEAAKVFTWISLQPKVRMFQRTFGASYTKKPIVSMSLGSKAPGERWMLGTLAETLPGTSLSTPTTQVGV